MPRVDNKKFYTSAIKKHGITPKGLNWRSKKSQEIRFHAILELLPKNLESSTIVDAGCGFGDFYLYMQKRGKSAKNYIGIDSLFDICSIASKNTGCEIITTDITRSSLPKASYYICSGAINILESFETHLFIRNCYEASENGFIFNVLYGDKKSQTYNYMNLTQIESIASNLGVINLQIKDDYLEDDITVGFFKSHILKNGFSS
ncbi:MAG: class I SAM-dependent methyltransferase [Campylobacterota bacterium]|nr:class I SAM-dependent methyltransferase [Campylobacterota bacterium]